MKDQVRIIQLSGILDTTQSQVLKEKIQEILEKDNSIKTVLIDFKDVTFMDSSGLGALVLAFRALQDVDKKLVICSINEQVRILFELTGMDKVFEIFPNQAEFNKVVLSKIN
jgi:anti-anti-sigma factor